MQFVRTILLIIIASAFLTGCFNLEDLDKAVVDKNKELSEKAHNKVGEKVEEGKQQLKDYTKQQIQTIATDLSNEAKSSIESWLVENALNQYGDSIDSVYTGGTPLFDEATGKSRDRFEYILENNPELIEKLDLNINN